MKHPNLQWRAGLRKGLTYFLLSLWALMVLFPFYWMVLTSIKGYGAYNSEWIPQLYTLAPTLQNYRDAFTAVPLGGYFVNTILFTVATTALMLAVTVLAAFAFARLRFPGRDLVFTLFLSFMMIPNELVVITNFVTITDLDLRNTFTGLILPSVTSVFYIYLLKENFAQVPDELYYAAKADGAYFLYELQCSEEDAAKLEPGTKIRVTGFKGEWAGEVEIMDGTFEFVEDGDTYIAEPLDVTELLGTDELIAHQNEAVCFKGLTIEKVEYKNGEPGDDIYVTVGYNGASYDFCVEFYLTGTDTEVYTTVGTLEAGDVVDIEGYLYWYEGVNTHITSITAVE